jgi:hypothetical protein
LRLGCVGDSLGAPLPVLPFGAPQFPRGISKPLP